MTDIDWSKAPEWATHYGPENDSYCESWYRVVDGKIVEFAAAGNAICVRQSADQGECFYHPIEDLIAPWTGVGIPPVGTVCEVEWCEEWHQCEVIAHFAQRCGMVAAFTVEIGGGAKSLDAFGAECFRPIRTPEQMAAEGRERAIEQMIDDTNILTGIMSDRRIMAGQLYDAGYRKVLP